MEKEIEYKKIPLFEGISEENLTKLLYCINSFKREYEKGETIILEKDKVPYIGIVLFGSVHMLKNDIWGNSTLLSYVTEGELFGENFAVMKIPESSVTFQAASHTKVLFLAASKIIHTCENACSFHAQIAENMFSQQQNSKYVVTPLPRIQLADYLSVNQSAMTRELSKMRDKSIETLSDNSLKINFIWI